MLGGIVSHGRRCPVSFDLIFDKPIDEEDFKNSGGEFS
jgi:hypothetical protein